MDRLVFVLTFASALGSGLIAGVFFAFSAFVMKALARVAPAQGITAMQSINVVVLNPVFLGVFLGTAAGCVVLVICALTRWQKAGAGYLLAGSLLYLAGTVLVTIIFNVPRNDALAAVDPASAEGAKLWADYVRTWTGWNHVRTVAAFGAGGSVHGSVVRSKVLIMRAAVLATIGSLIAVFAGRADTNSESYFPPPESKGGWRKVEADDGIRRLGVDPEKLDALRQWLLQSDDRKFAATVVRRGYIVLEVERGNSSRTDARRVASVSKAICATVLAIASEQSQQGLTPRKMKFDDPAFDFIPWAKPLSDSRKAKITVRQLLNHTSGICPEATGAPNDGSWEYILGHSGDERTAKLAFDPGTGCGYSTHALAHAALVCETVTGKPYDQFAIEALFKPIGVEHWSFQYYDGGEKYGRHPSHGIGMPARDLARIGYCMLRDGQWNGKQVVPKWFVNETAAPTHDVKTPEMRWKLHAEIFSHGWELPARHWVQGGRSGAGIPADARAKPGSGGQFIAFVPSLDLVVTRQTGSSGEWQFEEYLRRACAAVHPGPER